MLQINSLRFRVAFFYALFGAGLSILLSGVIFLTVQELGHRLMDETLISELDILYERQMHDLKFVPPNTVSIMAYVVTNTDPGQDIPLEIKYLPPGNHNVTIADTDYRVLVADKNRARYFMLFDTEGQHKREAKFFRFLVFAALLMTLASARGGFWLAVRIINPVTHLAEQVAQAEPGEERLTLVELAREDEVGELARAFDRYLHRLQEFIERESYFTADVSHELRTPLAIILGTVEVLEQDGALSVKQKERIERIKRAVQDMIELTNALLLMAREHLPATDEQPCQVGEVMRSCIDKHQMLIGKRPILMELNLMAEIFLHVERPLLEIVIGNLIRNALFNTESGSVTLRLEADRISVQDTGSGMRPEELARALERYYKGPSSAGAGVGLSLVKRICDRYGWRISLESEAGQGTKAEIIFSAKDKG
jgi:signal transduction histidine kinase